MKNKIYIVGIGPGNEDDMTIRARKVITDADTVIGYTTYLKLIPSLLDGKELLSTPMKKEIDRCKLCFEKAMEGRKVALICSGDAGVYGLASLMYEMGRQYEDIEIEVVPGVTAALSGAAILGAPINHDFCLISLSDLLTPWDVIEKRLKSAAEGDFIICLYNPGSHTRTDYLQRACDILLEKIDGARACGYVENIGRDGCNVHTCNLLELRDTKVNMFTTVFIGNSTTVNIRDLLVTSRGYKL